MLRYTSDDCSFNERPSSGRQGVATTLKVTNNLLAAVLVLTVVPPETGFSEAALEYCCSLISKKLLEKDVRLFSVIVNKR